MIAEVLPSARRASARSCAHTSWEVVDGMLSCCWCLTVVPAPADLVDGGDRVAAAAFLNRAQAPTCPTCGGPR